MRRDQKHMRRCHGCRGKTRGSLRSDVRREACHVSRHVMIVQHTTGFGSFRYHPFRNYCSLYSIIAPRTACFNHVTLRILCPMRIRNEKSPLERGKVCLFVPRQIIGGAIITSCRCACFDHLCAHMIELRGVSTRDHRSSETLFQIFPCVPGDRAASLCDSFIGIKSNRLLLLREFPCGNHGELVESQLRSAHVIPEALFLKTCTDVWSFRTRRG